MSNRIIELKPVMTKAKALGLVLDYVKEFGFPVNDVILYCDLEAEGDHLKTVNEWTYKGLCKFLTES